MREIENSEEGRKVMTEMTFIYSTVTLNPWVSQLPEVKFNTRGHLMQGDVTKQM